MKIDHPRPLNDEERAVLNFLLQSEFDGVEQLRAQVAGARVVGGCDCGCPTIYMEVDAHSPSSGIAEKLAPVEAVVSPEAHEIPGSIILFLKDGRLSSMEYVWYDQPPDRWPAPDRLTYL